MNWMLSASKRGFIVIGKKWIGIIICLLVLTIMYFVPSSLAQGLDDDPPMFTLSYIGDKNETGEVTIDYEDLKIISFTIQVKNNDENKQSAVISMLYDLTGDEIEVIGIPIVVDFNDTARQTFTITLDEPLDLPIGETRTIRFRVRNETTQEVRDTLDVYLKQIPFYTFEITSVDAEGDDHRLLEGNEIGIKVKGNYTGNSNCTLVAKAFVDGTLVDTQYIPSDITSRGMQFDLRWRNPEPGSQMLKVEVYRDDHGTPVRLAVSENMVKVESKVTVPTVVWLGTGMIIVIIFLSITLIVRKKKQIHVSEPLEIDGDGANGHDEKTGKTEPVCEPVPKEDKKIKKRTKKKKTDIGVQ